MMRNRFPIVYYTEGSKRTWAVLGFLVIFQIDYIRFYAIHLLCRLRIPGCCLHLYQLSLFLPLSSIPPINPVAENLWLCLLIWLRLSSTFRVYATLSPERPTGEERIHTVVRWSEPLLFSNNQYLKIFCCKFIIS